MYVRRPKLSGVGGVNTSANTAVLVDIESFVFGKCFRVLSCFALPDLLTNSWISELMTSNNCVDRDTSGIMRSRINKLRSTFSLIKELLWPTWYSQGRDSRAGAGLALQGGPFTCATSITMSLNSVSQVPQITKKGLVDQLLVWWAERLLVQGGGILRAAA